MTSLMKVPINTRCFFPQRQGIFNHFFTVIACDTISQGGCNCVKKWKKVFFFKSLKPFNFSLVTRAGSPNTFRWRQIQSIFNLPCKFVILNNSIFDVGHSVRAFKFENKERNLPIKKLLLVKLTSWTMREIECVCFREKKIERDKIVPYNLKQLVNVVIK